MLQYVGHGLTMLHGLDTIGIKPTLQVHVVSASPLVKGCSEARRVIMKIFKETANYLTNSYEIDGA